MWHVWGIANPFGQPFAYSHQECRLCHEMRTVNLHTGDIRPGTVRDFPVQQEQVARGE